MIQQNPQIQQIYNGLQQFMNNPGQIMAAHGIPADCANDPGRAIQFMMDRGVIDQRSYTWARQMAGTIAENPMIRGLFKR